MLNVEVQELWSVEVAELGVCRECGGRAVEGGCGVWGKQHVVIAAFRACGYGV